MTPEGPANCDGWEDTIIRRLAIVYHCDDKARSLLWRSGFPRDKIPAFADPIVFWTRVFVSVADGVLESIRPIIETAAADYPNNEAFSGFLRGDSRPVAGRINGTRLEPDRIVIVSRLTADSTNTRPGTGSVESRANTAHLSGVFQLIDALRERDCEFEIVIKADGHYVFRICRIRN